jgi:hypothetical protein
MTRPRQILYRSLDVHRPSEALAPPRGRAISSPGTVFARILRPTRRALPAPTEISLPPGAQALMTEDQSTHDDGDAREERPPSAEESEAPIDDVAPDWAQSLVPTSDTLDPLLVEATRVQRLGNGAPPGRFDSVAHTIASFCNERTVGDSEGWNVRIALREDVLEETTLELSISSYWLQLRFQTLHPDSRRLILDHQQELTDQLIRMLLRRRDIAITLD